jgi:hypothetical protein
LLLRIISCEKAFYFENLRLPIQIHLNCVKDLIPKYIKVNDFPLTTYKKYKFSKGSLLSN